MPNEDGTLLATTDEDFSPFEGSHVPGDTWGFARLWGLANPASPAHLSDITTPHSLTNVAILSVLLISLLSTPHMNSTGWFALRYAV